MQLTFCYTANFNYGLSSRTSSCVAVRVPEKHFRMCSRWSTPIKSPNQYSHQCRHDANMYVLVDGPAGPETPLFLYEYRRGAFRHNMCSEPNPPEIASTSDQHDSSTSGHSKDYSKMKCARVCKACHAVLQGVPCRLFPVPIPDLSFLRNMNHIRKTVCLLACAHLPVAPHRWLNL